MCMYMYIYVCSLYTCINTHTSVHVQSAWCVCPDVRPLDRRARATRKRAGFGSETGLAQRVATQPFLPASDASPPLVVGAWGFRVLLRVIFPPASRPQGCARRATGGCRRTWSGRPRPTHRTWPAPRTPAVPRCGPPTPVASAGLARPRPIGMRPVASRRAPSAPWRRTGAPPQPRCPRAQTPCSARWFGPFC